MIEQLGRFAFTLFCFDHLNPPFHDHLTFALFCSCFVSSLNPSFAPCCSPYIGTAFLCEDERKGERQSGNRKASEQQSCSPDSGRRELWEHSFFSFSCPILSLSFSLSILCSFCCFVCLNLLPDLYVVASYSSF